MSGAIGEVLNSAAAIAVVFGLCLLCHEAGHFALAKLFGMHVEEFALGFGRALLSHRRGETTYRLNIFPYGAYVRIAGMEPGGPVVERGFHSRPRWQSAMVLVGGSVANMMLAVVLFAVVTYWTGVPDPSDTGIYVSKVVADSPAEAAGVLPGDQIVAIDGAVDSLQVKEVAAGSGAEQAGIRPGDVLERAAGREIYVPPELTAALRSAGSSGVKIAVVDYAVPDVSDQQRIVTLQVPPSLRADDASGGSRSPEQRLGLVFEPLGQASLVGYISARPGKLVRLGVVRQGSRLELQMVASTANARAALRDDSGMLYSRIRPSGRVGVVLRPAMRPAGLREAARVGLLRSLGSAVVVIESVRLMLRRDAEPELAGPVAIMAISVEKAKVGWDAVLGWGGMVSAILAVVNLFPIPPFDGFRLLLLGCEAIIRRRVYPKLEWVLSVAGFVLIVFMFVMLTSKDVANLVKYGTP